VVDVPMTTRHLSEPMKLIAALVDAGRFHHDGNLASMWMFANVEVFEDRNENVFPRKSKAENKIDAAVATILAMGRAMVESDNGAHTQVFVDLERAPARMTQLFNLQAREHQSRVLMSHLASQPGAMQRAGVAVRNATLVTSSDAAGMARLFDPLPTASGFPVNDQTSMLVSAVFACLSKISGAVLDFLCTSTGWPQTARASASSRTLPCGGCSTRARTDVDRGELEGMDRRLRAPARRPAHRDPAQHREKHLRRRHRPAAAPSRQRAGARRRRPVAL